MIGVHDSDCWHASADTTQRDTRVEIADLREVHQRCHPRESFDVARSQRVSRGSGRPGLGTHAGTTRNPRRGDPHDNTRLLELELKLLHSGQRHPDYYAIKFRAAARY